MSKSIEWTTLSVEETFTTRQKAQRFIDIMLNQHFGRNPEPKLVEFKISEKKGKFYIEYRMLEKHAL